MSLNESIVPQPRDAALEWFGELGYAVGHGPQLAPGEPASRDGGRDSFGEVVRSRFARTLTRPLPEGEEKREALQQIHPKIPDEAREKALRKALRMDVPSLVAPHFKPSRTLATLVGTSLPKLLGGRLRSIAADNVAGTR